MPTKKKLYYRIVTAIIRVFYKKRAFEGLENIPEEPCVIIANHAKTHGPLTFELFYPRRKLIWSAFEMSDEKLAPSYAYRDFWSGKPKKIRWFYKALAYIFAPLAAKFFRCADCLPVYRDERVFATFKGALKGLNDGSDMIIFPEKHEPYNAVINDFHEAFVDLGRLYYKKTGKRLAFVPCYNAPMLRKVVFAKPIYYDPNVDSVEQRKIILNKLKGEITALAKELPTHKIVPYENVRKKKYKLNSEEITEI